MTPKEFVEQFHKTHPSTDKWASVMKDHEALISLIEEYDIKIVFEFGTWKGCTTLLLYSHPNIYEVTTIDIHKDMGIAYSGPGHSLQEEGFYGTFFKDQRGVNIKQIFCDSMEYKPTKQYDMVFIDANHDYEHVKNDSELAFKMAKKVIAWHDYHNANAGVDEYLDGEMEGEFSIYPGSCITYMEVK